MPHRLNPYYDYLDKVESAAVGGQRGNVEMKRSWYEMQGDRDARHEPCPAGVGSDLPMPRMLAGWPLGSIYRPRTPVTDFNEVFRQEALEVLRRGSRTEEPVRKWTRRRSRAAARPS